MDCLKVRRPYMDNYGRFQELINKHPSGAPKSQVFLEILQILFTEDEIKVALNMSFKNKGVEDIAKGSSLSTEEASRILEAMADKAVIFCREKDGNKTYALLPTVPGLFEFPLMNGGGTPEADRLSKLWVEYLTESLPSAFYGTPTPQTRVIPVEKSLEGVTTVHPYEEVAQLVEKAEYIAVAHCACRVSVGKCDSPKEVCMIFGHLAEFMVLRKHARHVSKAEAMEVLNMAEKAGLVHTSNNSADKVGLICNCCPCCCLILRGRVQLNNPRAFSPSRYEAKVDEDGCIGCGICADERCPMKAIEISNDMALVNPDKCIGCGLCVTGCPEQALKLIQRADAPEIPNTIQDMVTKILMEKGKLEGFLNVMQK
jgi:NAD-dependent dihydropyrimidine dehydrogenase PreA subunit